MMLQFHDDKNESIFNVDTLLWERGKRFKM